MDDEQRLVEVCRVMVERDDDGECVYSAQANDWLTLFGPADIAAMLSMAASAVELLAEAFDPDVNKTAPAPVLAFERKTQPEETDDDRPDQPA